MWLKTAYARSSCTSTSPIPSHKEILKRVQNDARKNSNSRLPIPDPGSPVPNPPKYLNLYSVHPTRVQPSHTPQTMQIFKSFTFDSAHFLPHVPEGHKCRRMHGHTYLLTVYLDGDLDERLGWVADFAEVKSVVKPLVEALDHRVLNDIEGLENPTCEHIAVWLWDKIKPKLPQLSKIKLMETPTSGTIYSGN